MADFNMKTAYNSCCCRISRLGVGNTAALRYADFML